MICLELPRIAPFAGSLVFGVAGLTGGEKEPVYPILL